MRRAQHWLPAFTLVLAVGLSASLSPTRAAPREPSSSPTPINGRVLDDATGQPLARARVGVAAASSVGTAVVLTDAGGRFSLTVPSGDVRVTAIKRGYARTEVAPPRDGAPLEIRLLRGAAISGRVVDELGEPVLVARVAVEEVARTGARAATLGVAQTDDQGEYRIAGIAPGAVTVSVQTMRLDPVREVRDGREMLMYPAVQTIYYPNASSNTEAAQLVLTRGDERTAIDFTVPRRASGNQPFSAFHDAPMASLLRPVDPLDPRHTTASIRGVVSGEGRGLPYAQVVLVPGAGGPAQLTATDATGVFVFRNLASGRYRIGASKAGYFAAGSRGPMTPSQSGPAVDIAEGEQRDDVRVPLARWGTVSGRVVDENDEPVQGARVRLFRVMYERGRRRLVPADTIPPATDDRGLYRIFGVPAGAYMVGASVSEVSTALLPGYALTFYPGTEIAAAAQFVTVDAGGEVSGADIPLVPSRNVRVTGTIVNARGEPTSDGSLQLVPRSRSTAPVGLALGARILATGAFEFPNVAPGEYILQAYHGTVNEGEGEFAALPVTITDGDLVNLVVRRTDGSNLAGRVSFDPPLAPGASVSMPAVAAVAVDPDQSPGGGPPTAWAGDDGRFQLAGLHGPRRLQVQRVPAGWTLASIRVNGIDATDRVVPFGSNQPAAEVEVLLTNRLTRLTGTVADDDGHSMPAAVVIVFATDRDRWQVASRYVTLTASGDDGAFTLDGLPFATYYAAAVSRVPEGDEAWRDPEFLASLVARAVTVTLSEGDTRAVALRISGR